MFPVPRLLEAISLVDTNKIHLSPEAREELLSQKLDVSQMSAKLHRTLMDLRSRANSSVARFSTPFFQ